MNNRENDDELERMRHVPEEAAAGRTRQTEQQGIGGTAESEQSAGNSSCD
mgnify:CR=1 FL=1